MSGLKRGHGNRCRECGTLTGAKAYTWTEVRPTRSIVRKFCDIKCYRAWYKKGITAQHARNRQT